LVYDILSGSERNIRGHATRKGMDNQFFRYITY